MNVQKFTARTAREALRKVRDALGADAVILSNRVVDGAVEVLALGGDDVASIAAPAAGTEMAQPRLDLAHLDYPLESYANLGAQQQPAPQTPPLEALMAARLDADMDARQNALQNARLDAPLDRRPEPVAAAAAPVGGQGASAPQPALAASFPISEMSALMAVAIAQARDSAAAEMSGMRDEMRAMRGLMEDRLSSASAGAAPGRDAPRTAVLRELLAAGFSASLARFLSDKLPEGKTGEAGWQWIKTVMARNLACMPDEDALLGGGGVFALVGPTGVGKTTTTAKLAARCVMRHGADKVALITTDAYRIGGHEQLRIYGKILGVMVHSVKDEADLRIALREMRNKHIVLIDTVGVSQRDQMVGEQVAMLSQSGADVRRLLCLNATSTNETLAEVVRAYQGSGLAGAIMTKLDEAASVGNVLDVVIRHKLMLYYISNGQRVPEDLQLPDPAALIEHAFSLERDDANEYADAELSLLMARGAGRVARAAEVSLG
ncbi:flagellar biosynthesis protein FlhF [Massilia glaciei]|uniref:Flagellar biosynthesis protein FlhF n=1 Tax=Massilia glaciei TaxID=1524097 RepID=A0A2U2HND0_9BURK|nr:flagellar biosynthesis protein FlhF [Massilia glaciei]PWF48936.1 flagellar biosynthesis protein FlhF [Massilia glaciei]